jgi:hypothetical protein
MSARARVRMLVYAYAPPPSSPTASLCCAPLLQPVSPRPHPSPRSPITSPQPRNEPRNEPLLLRPASSRSACNEELQSCRDPARKLQSGPAVDDDAATAALGERAGEAVRRRLHQPRLGVPHQCGGLGHARYVRRAGLLRLPATMQAGIRCLAAARARPSAVSAPSDAPVAPSPGGDVGRGEPGPGADVGAAQGFRAWRRASSARCARRACQSS